MFKKSKILICILLILSFIANAQYSPVGIDVATIAPDFNALDQQGENFHLYTQLKKGPVVIVFYRGQWCPYCNKQLSQLEDSLSFILNKGATLIAVSPEKQENIAKTIQKTKATYPVIFDEGLKIMKAYDVAFDVDENTTERYKKFGIDFAEVNGNNGAVLPVPAVYIINSKGEITFKHFNADYKKRVSVKEIVANL